MVHARFKPSPGRWRVKDAPGKDAKVKIENAVDYVRSRVDMADNVLMEAQAAYDRSVPKSVRMKLEMARNSLNEALHDLEYEQVMEAEHDREQREGR